MRCHSVACGTVNQTQLVTQLDTQSFSAARVIRVYDSAGSVIETHKRKGDFRENARVIPLPKFRIIRHGLFRHNDARRVFQRSHSASREPVDDIQGSILWQATAP
jgi:hypothetical protein